jgi:hypothetical protein
LSRSLRAPWICFLLLPAAAAAADVVRLRSGDVVEGRVDDLGDRLRVETSGGAVSLRWKDVDAVLPGRAAAEVFAEKRKAVGDKDVTGLYALALWAQRAGLPDEARGTFEAVVKADPEHAGARDALSQQKADGAWQGGTKLLEAKGFVARDGAWMLREEADLRARQAEARRELSMDEKKVEDLLAKAGKGPDAARKFATDALATVPVESLFRPALRALRGGEPGTRAVAATALGRMKDEVDVRRPLLRSAVMDKDPEVRLASAAALRSLADPQIVKPLAKAMWSASPEIRANAAEALGEVSGVGAVEWLITRVSTSGGPGARNHIFVGSQVTYVSDFDVEIAQAAQIGDPIVQTIREGAMLDARVLNVREEYTILERRVAFTALRKATGKSFGEDPQAWKEWFEKEGRKELTAAAR